MKILVFTSLFPNTQNLNKGIFIERRIRHYSRFGCQVKVVAPIPYFPAFKFLRIFPNWYKFSQIPKKWMLNSNKVHFPRYFQIPKIGMTLYGLMMFFSVLHFVWNIRKEFDFDIIDGHWIYPDGFAAVLLAKWFKRKVVVSARGSDINAYTKLFFIRYLIKYTLKQADLIITVSHDLKTKIQNLGIDERKIKIIPNGVDISQFRPLPENELEEILPFEKSGRIILTVGALRRVKNQKFLIEAFSQIVSLEKYKDLKLIIVGSGYQKDLLEKQIANLDLSHRVFLVGAVPNDKLVHWYNHADLFCLPSLNEGCPNVLLEALACHVPVIATKVGGIPDILSSENLGILAEPSSLKSLKLSLIKGLEKKWTTPSFERFLEGKSWDKVTKNVCNAFFKLKL